MAKPKETIANERGEITLPLDGQNYCLRPSYVAIKKAQADTGQSLAELTAAANGQRLSIEDMAIITQEMMKAWGMANPDDPLSGSHTGASRARLEELIYEAGALKIQPRLAVVLIAALTGQVNASGEMKAVAKTKAPATAE